ncbi:MAG: leucine-rich repeat domain-containing protein [Bacteroidaceae bacterium]|nr:leucine-rich repeat domain-containing protein [Bacteroidaceae bacterium]
MKKNIFIYAAALSVLLGVSSCDSQSDKKGKQKTVAVEKSEAAEASGDIFFYTSKHRADKYKPTEERIGFGSQIMSVNQGEFQDNKNIREVWIAPQIQHITQNAFSGCTSLEKVHFQGEVAVINDEAFKDCSALKNLRVDVYTIGLDAFRGCTSLETARFGEHIWWIRDGAFGNCRKLKSVLMGITMQKIEDGAFEGCTGIEEFSIPNDFKNRMFGIVPSASKWKRIYLLSTEYYAMPKNCTPQKGCTLYVPDAFLAKFRADADWMQFGSIEPLSKSKYFTAEGFWK